MSEHRRVSRKSRSPKAVMCLVCGQPCREPYSIHGRCVAPGFAWLAKIWLFLGIQDAMKAHPGLHPVIAWKSRR